MRILIPRSIAFTFLIGLSCRWWHNPTTWTLSFYAAEAAITDPPPPPSRSIPDEWEEWDYYSILGIKNDTNVKNAAEIRKAYRNQAKRFHPDKIRTNNTNTTTNDQVNARFARLAEAYQVLSDPDKRREYDLYLHQQQQPNKYRATSQQYAQEHDSWSNSHSSFQGDPFAIFEDIFREFFDPNSRYYDTASFEDKSFDYQDSYHYHPRQAPVIRVTEEQQVILDAWGQEMIRLVRTEEYADTTTRTWTQDFVETWDPYHHSWVYQPIGEPILMMMPPQGTTSSSSRGGGTYSQQPRLFKDDAILWPHEGLGVNTVLENGPYRLFVTPTCTVVIVHTDDDDDDDDDTIVWSSAPPDGALARRRSRRRSCALELQGPRLVLMASDATSMSHEIVWYSDIPDEEEMDMLTGRGRDVFYLARLDSDAALSVYRLDGGSLRTYVLRQMVFTTPILQGLFDQITGLMSFDVGHQSKTQLYRLRCIYSTSPAGCFRVGRLLVRLVRQMTRLIRSFF